MRYLSLFSGIGGGDLGLQHLIGMECVGYVEWDKYCCRVLEQRIKDGFLADAPIFCGDIRGWIKQGYAEAYSGLVDVVAGGWPCQPHSKAGNRRGGDDERDMWSSTADAIRIIKPQWFLGENVEGVLSTSNGRYWGNVLRDLATMGYDARWGVLSACSTGQSHMRERMFVVANSIVQGRKELLRDNISHVTKADNPRKRYPSNSLDAVFNAISQLEKELGESSVFGIDDGVPYRVERLGACGNGQVPSVAAKAWRVLRG